MNNRKIFAITVLILFVACGANPTGTGILDFSAIEIEFNRLTWAPGYSLNIYADRKVTITALDNYPDLPIVVESIISEEEYKDLSDEFNPYFYIYPKKYGSSVRDGGSYFITLKNGEVSKTIEVSPPFDLVPSVLHRIVNRLNSILDKLLVEHNIIYHGSKR